MNRKGFVPREGEEKIYINKEKTLFYFKRELQELIKFMGTTQPLPKYIVEKVNGVWEVYNTELSVVEDVYTTKEDAEEYKKKLIEIDKKYRDEKTD